MQEYLDRSLMEACNEDKERAVEELLKAGANVNYHRPGDRYTPLHMAVAKTNLGMLRALIAAGAKPNEVQGSARTPLHMAALKKCWVEGVRELLGAGADPRLKDQGGDTPLDDANNIASLVAHNVTSERRAECVKLLQEAMGDKQGACAGAAAGAAPAPASGSRASDLRAQIKTLIEELFEMEKQHGHTYATLFIIRDE